MEACWFGRYCKPLLFWRGEDESWLGASDSPDPVSQAELIKKLCSTKFNDKNIITTTSTSSADGWLIDHAATLNKTSKEKENWSKRLKIPNYYGTGCADRWALGTQCPSQSSASSCTHKQLSAVLPTTRRAEQSWCEVNLLAREALGNHLSGGTLLLLSSSANVMETVPKATLILNFRCTETRSQRRSARLSSLVLPRVGECPEQSSSAFE